jgi:hypothetical protein
VTVRLQVGILASVVVAMLAATTPAAGETIFASPHGDGTFPCKKSDPCPVLYAVDQGSSSADVFLKAGRYEIGNDYLDPPPGAYIHGPRKGKRARVIANDTGVFATYAGKLTDLTIVSTGGQALFANASFEKLVVERVRAFANDETALACLLPYEPGFTRNTLCVNRGDGPGMGVSVGGGPVAFTTNIVGVTAVSRGDQATSAGISVSVSSAIDMTVNISNTIAIGGPNAPDLLARDNPGGSDQVTVHIDHSNFGQAVAEGDLSEVVLAGSNQIDKKPRFVSPAKNDYRERPSSPTINEGTADNGFLGLGRFDFLGAKRTVGRPDIGADEAPRLRRHR